MAPPAPPLGRKARPGRQRRGIFRNRHFSERHLSGQAGRRCVAPSWIDRSAGACHSSGDPPIDLLFKQNEGQLPTAKDCIVEAAYVEFRAELFFGFPAQCLHLDHADLIAGCLPRHHDIASHLGADLPVGSGRIFREICDGLLFGPAFGVEAGIDHEADCPPYLAREASEIGIGVLIRPYLLGEFFGVKAPALLIGVEIGAFPEFRNVGQLARDSEIQMMAGQRLVIDRIFELGLRFRTHVGEVK